MKNNMKLVGLLSVLLVAASSSKATTETVIDLTAGTPVNNSINGAIVFAADPRPTGTGFIDSFLREQANGNGSSELGVNTSASSPPFDDKSGPFTHNLSVANLAVVSYNSQNYYEFFLDANQEHNGPISLTSFKIFVTSGSPLGTSADVVNEVNTDVAKFDLENGSAGSVRVDVHSGTGSGSGDMFILVPVSDIGPIGNLYLDAGFSGDLGLFATPTGVNPTGFAPNDGFEEWWAITKTPGVGVPDGGSTVALLGMALAGMGLVYLKTGKAGASKSA